MKPCAALTHPPAPLSGTGDTGVIKNGSGGDAVEQKNHGCTKPQPAEEEQDEVSEQEEATTGDEQLGEQHSNSKTACRQEASEAEQEEHDGEQATCVEGMEVVEKDAHEEDKQEEGEDDGHGEDMDGDAETERKASPGGDTKKDDNDKYISDGKDENDKKNITEDKDGSDHSEGVPEIMRVRRKNIARNQAMIAALSVPQASPCGD